MALPLEIRLYYGVLDKPVPRTQEKLGFNFRAKTPKGRGLPIHKLTLN